MCFDVCNERAVGLQPNVFLLIYQVEYQLFLILFTNCIAAKARTVLNTKRPPINTKLWRVQFFVVFSNFPCFGENLLVKYISQFQY